MRSTIFDSKPYDKKAVAEILISPASAVASKIDDSVESILFSLNTVAPLRDATRVEARYFTCDAQDIARIMISGLVVRRGGATQPAIDFGRRLVGLVPIGPISQIRYQRHPQLRHTSHQLRQHLLDLIELGKRHIQHQLIVHLHHH